MNELIETLREARHEIESLRRRNEILAAKVETMDSFMRVLYTFPAQHPKQSFAPDVVFGIVKHISKLEDDQKP